MKQFFKGAAITAVILIVFMGINVICNINGINLNFVSNGAVTAVCAVLIYRALTSNEKKKDD